MTHKLTIFDRMAIWEYITRVEMAMPELFTRRDFKTWKQIKKDLTAEICAQASQVGVRQAIADLGPATILGTNYQLAIRGHRPVLWTQGFLTAVAVWMLLFTVVRRQPVQQNAHSAEIVAVRMILRSLSRTLVSRWQNDDSWNLHSPLVQPA